MPRLLIAGIGNIFRGDDAFGCEVARVTRSAAARGEEADLVRARKGWAREVSGMLMEKEGWGRKKDVY